MGGCVSAPPEPGQRVAAPGDGLRKVQIDELDAALQRCNAVVTALPDDPQPRNDRSLLYSLTGNNAAACRDSFKAAELLEQQRKAHRSDPKQGPPPDRVLADEISLRQRSCERLTNRPAAAAPSPVTPAAPKP